MTTSTREFLRQFPRMKRLALAGQKIHLKSGRTAFVFQAEKGAGDGFYGALKGVVTKQAKAKDLFSTGAAWEAES